MGVWWKTAEADWGIHWQILCPDGLQGLPPCLYFERCVVISASSADGGILGWQPVSTSSQENNTQRQYVAKEFSRSDQHNWAHRTANQLLWKECPRKKVVSLLLISQRCKCHLLERIFALCNMWQWTTLWQWGDVLAEEQLWQRSIIGVSACPPVWSTNNGDERVHNYYGDVMNDCIFGGKTLPFTNIIDNIVY